MARKPIRKLYKIGEVMRYTGLSRQTLHNYTMLGLITPEERTPHGHRLYPESVFERLRRVELLKRHRTLQEVREILRAEDAAAAEKDGRSAPDSPPKEGEEE